MSIVDSQQICPNCRKNVLLTDYFCPSCGKKLKNKPLSTSVGRQIYVYLLSFLLPPLGLWPAIKYLKQDSDKSRMIGFIAVVLTIVSAVLTIWFTLGFVSAFNQQLNSNLNLYR